MKIWPKVKLGQVQVGSTLLRITLLAHGKSYLIIICLNSHEKLTKREIRSSSSQFEHCSESMAHRKSYLVIICPNSHEKLTKSEIRSSSSRFEHCSESLIWPIGSHIWSLFAPIQMKSWPKVKLGQVQVSSNIAQNHSSSPWEVISGHYWPQFTWKVDQKWN